MVNKIVKFLEGDVWRIHSRKLPKRKSLPLRILRVFLLAFREFKSNRCQLNASALTFYSLLSIVPMAAMAFGVAKGFGFEKVLEKQLLEKMPGQEATLTQVITFANNLLANTKGGLIAGLGVILLFWTVIKVLDSIEESFNDIWGIHKGRSLGRKVSDYLSMMLICPFLLILSSGATVFISTQVKLILEKLAFLGSAAGFILLGLELLPFLMVWALFTFMYIFMPNTKVKFSSGLLAGVIAGSVYQVVQVIYVKFQVGVANANVIYGSFAALPLFLIWLQMSWRIVLFGTELAFAHQNVDTYEFEQDCRNANHSFKTLIALEAAVVVAKRFAAGKKPMTAADISDQLEIPIRLARDILFDLVEAGVVIEIPDTDQRIAAYHPGSDINNLTIHSVLTALRERGTVTIPFAPTREIKKLTESLAVFEKVIQSSPANLLLKDV